MKIIIQGFCPGSDRVVRKLSCFVLSLWVICSWALIGILQAESLNGNDLFQPDSLLEIKIELPGSDWKTLCEQSRAFQTIFQNPNSKPFTYFKGNVSINGVRIESVGIRKKGFIGSLDGYRPSLKIKFDEYVEQEPIDGLDRLTLNNNKQDSSLVSQFLTYKVFRNAGLHAPRCNFARVTVNGEYLGIYSNVESVRKPFLKKAFGDDSGILYEGTIADFYPKAIGRLEVKKNNVKNVLVKPMRLAELLAAEESLALSEVESIVDIPYFLKFWAIESLIGFWDGYTNNQNNYFTYDNPENGKFYFMPWGADGAFNGGKGMMRRMGNVDSIAVYSNSMLANRLYWSGDIAERYRKVMRGLLKEVWHEEKLIAEIDRIEKLVENHLHDQQAESPSSMQDVRQFIRTRSDNVERLLTEWPAKIPTSPRKPMYTVEVGRANGTFEITWSDEVNRATQSSGSVNLKLILDGEELELSDIRAFVGPSRAQGFGRGFGRRRGGRPGGSRRGLFGDGNNTPAVTFTFSGMRSSDGQDLTLTLNLNRENYASGVGKTWKVNGSLRQENQGGFGGFSRRGPGRSVSGELKLTAAGDASGEGVSGSMNLTITETRGGMFGRR